MLTKRNLLLWSALLVTLGLTWHRYQHEMTSEISLPTRNLNSIPIHSQTLAANEVKLLLKTRALTPSKENLFSVPAKEVSPPIRYVASNASTPVAPALPFKYLGRMLAGASGGVMLESQGEVMHIQVGDILLGQYKVQAINENMGNLKIQFLYLPLNQIQTLSAQTDH